MVRGARRLIVAGTMALAGGCQLVLGLDEGHLRGTGGAGGAAPADGGGVGGAASTGGTSTGGTSTTATGSTGGGDAGATCDIGHLVISEIRSRGVHQSSDEFIELFNATGAPVVLDVTWQISERAASASAYSVRWTGKGKSIPAWGHYLVAGQAYDQAPTPDDTDTAGISDASSLVLGHGGETVDAVCYYYGSNPFNSTYTCEGTPVVNPHDMTTSTDSDTSIERKPGGTSGNCTDTGDNAADFIVQMPSTPESTASPPTP